MIYSLLRAIAVIALRWFYSDVTVVREGDEEESVHAGPLLVVVNHPNALVDVLMAGQAVPRRLLFTGKATLFTNPVASRLLRSIGVIPLRRAADEQGPADAGRNAQAFADITAALRRDAAVLIFPEGRSHDEPALAPLRTGAARIALAAREVGVVALRVLPIGLVFEEKDRPRSRALAIVGQPLHLDRWPESPDAVSRLTEELDRRLRAVTVNYSTLDEAIRETRRVALVAALLREPVPTVGVAESLELQMTVARAMRRLRNTQLGDADPKIAARASVLEQRVDALQRQLDRFSISSDDIRVSPSTSPGVWFVIREVTVALIIGPVALWGWLNHLLPFHAATAIGKARRESRADPAMRTIVAGAAFVLTVYMVQGAIVAFVLGPWIGVAYVVSLPIAADLNFRFRDRLKRVRRRSRAFLLFRARPGLRRNILREAEDLRRDILDLASAVVPTQ